MMSVGCESVTLRQHSVLRCWLVSFRLIAAAVENNVLKIGIFTVRRRLYTCCFRCWLWFVFDFPYIFINREKKGISFRKKKYFVPVANWIPLHTNALALKSAKKNDRNRIKSTLWPVIHTYITFDDAWRMAPNTEWRTHTYAYIPIVWRCASVQNLFTQDFANRMKAKMPSYNPAKCTKSILVKHSFHFME